MRSQEIRDRAKNRYAQNKKWRTITLSRLDVLNDGYFLGYNKPFYELGYRGRNHYIVLLKDGEVIARGMMAINNILDLLERIEKVKVIL